MQVGSILASLESSSVRNNTLVLMTGDNGPWQV
jgi:arylsulfatase A-like enzyme